MIEESVQIPADGVALEGALALPDGARGLVLFAHGSGSSRHSPRNRQVAEVLRQGGIGTLLFDLLTLEEDQDHATRFNIDLLTRRLIAATRWVMDDPRTGDLAVGYFGSSTGAAAALRAAAELGPKIGAVVSRGGRPDLAEQALGKARSPTRLIVGGQDEAVLDLNRQAYDRLRTETELVIIPGATHLFEEPGALEEVARLAADWFRRHLGGSGKKAR